MGKMLTLERPWVFEELKDQYGLSMCVYVGWGGWVTQSLKGYGKRVWILFYCMCQKKPLIWLPRGGAGMTNGSRKVVLPKFHHGARLLAVACPTPHLAFSCKGW